jgi:hypothetical protein
LKVWGIEGHETPLYLTRRIKTHFENIQISGKWAGGIKGKAGVQMGVQTDFEKLET